MTSTMMGPQGYDTIMPQFTPYKGQPRKYSGENGCYHKMTAQKSRGCAPRGNCTKNLYSTPSNHYNQYQVGLQVPRNCPNPNKMLKKFDSNPEIPQFEIQPNFYKTNKRNMNYSGPKNYYGSTASESDSNASHSSSELNGFKIVHRGKIIHDETEEEIESPTEFGVNSCRLENDNMKFASSCLVIGPNSKEISLPSFA